MIKQIINELFISGFQVSGKKSQDSFLSQVSADTL
jgi:hypothetical protein